MSVVVTAAEKLLLACYAGPEQDAIDALVKLEDLVSNHVESGALPPCEDNSTSTLPAAPHQLMLNAVNIKDAHGGVPAYVRDRESTTWLISDNRHPHSPIPLGLPHYHTAPPDLLHRA